MPFIYVKPEHVGSLWIPSDGGSGEATVLSVGEFDVSYETDKGEVITRDRMGFSCRYSLVDDGPMDYEDDGQPSMYEEYQDLWDGDDNFLDWTVEDY